MPNQERWQSGRLRYLGKVVTGQLVPGFESPSLRQAYIYINYHQYIYKKNITSLIKNHIEYVYV